MMKIYIYNEIGHASCMYVLQIALVVGVGSTSTLSHDSS